MFENKSTKENTISILLVEDEKVDAMAISRFIQNEKLNYKLDISDSLKSAKKSIKLNRYDIIISDYRLADGTALDVIKLAVDIPVIITTASGSEEIAVGALRAGASDYLIKDLTGNYLKMLPVTVERILKQKELQTYELMLSQVLKDMADSVIILNKDKKVMFVNNAFLKKYGYLESEIIDIEASIIWSDKTIPEKIFNQKLNYSYKGEHQHITKDGTIFSALVTSTSIYDKSKKPFCYVTVCHDITEIKQSELKLEESAKELKRSNVDLEQYAYIVSHDLKEPLRMIYSYLELIGKKTENKFDKKLTDYLNFAIEGAKRMDELINGMLSYSRVGFYPKRLSSVDLNEIINLVKTDLSSRIKESEIQIEHIKLPQISGDSIQIRQLFQNLISNAIKFRKNKNGRIQITYKENKNEKIFCVEDNGIGFEPKFHEKIFTMFQRLHAKDKYEGTGIGLAICKKIVENHGGKIWAESEPGNFTRFFFTLQKKEIKK
ncbi:MAG: ATP-binding protein [Spirochaetia bacterium]|nr:ATP-binding protein [Spirochaetia bacterium]